MAAYRSGERLRDGHGVYDYTRKEGVEHTEIMAPPNTPEALKDREALWNEVEKVEPRKDSQVAREFILSLSHELDPDERIALVRDFAQEQLVDEGMIVDIAIHAPGMDSDERHHHAHMLCTTRHVDENGFGLKNRDWNTKAKTLGERKAFERMQNEALERAGRAERVSCDTLVKQREQALRDGNLAKAAELDREPQIPVGPGNKFHHEHLNDNRRFMENEAIKERNARKLSKSDTRASLLGKVQIDGIVKGYKEDPERLDQQRQDRADEKARRDLERKIVDERVAERFQEEYWPGAKRIRDGNQRLMKDQHACEDRMLSEDHGKLWSRTKSLFSSKAREARMNELVDKKKRQDDERAHVHDESRITERQWRANVRRDEKMWAAKGFDFDRRRAEKRAQQNLERKRDSERRDRQNELAARKVMSRPEPERSRERGYGRERSLEPSTQAPPPEASQGNSPDHEAA